MARFVLFLFLALLFFTATAHADRILEISAVAAPRTVEAGGRTMLQVTLEIHPPYHINANPPSFDYLIPTTVNLDPTPGIRVGRTTYPRGHAVAVGGFTEAIAVYDGHVTISIPISIAADHPGGTVRLNGVVSFQACDDHACLAPASLPFEATLKVKTPVYTVTIDSPLSSSSDTRFYRGENLSQESVTVTLTNRFQFEEAPPLETPVVAPQTGPARPEMSLYAWILAAFLGGLALNLTPCVYPLIPITIGYFARQTGGRKRTVLLAGLYVLALAVVFAILGSAAALTGSIFGSFLQNSGVLVLIALVMIIFAAGMMGAFEIRLPSSLNRFTAARPGPGGALMMGATVGIVAAPCIGPFVASLLAYVGGRGNPTEGFILFLSLGIGLGTPYIPLAILSGRLSAWPSAGPILVAAKRLLGLALLALAAWFLLPILGGYLFQITLGIIAVIGGGFTFFRAIAGEGRGTHVARRALAILLIAGGALLLGHIPSRPALAWRAYSPLQLAVAAQAGQPAIIDVYADWCIPCHELEAITFTNDAVRELFAGMIIMKADVTGPRIDPEVEKLATRLGIHGVPTVLFIDAQGRERTDLRLVGFEGPERFIERLRALRDTSLREERPAR